MRGGARVVRISTLSALERTQEGLDVSSTEARLIAAYGKRLSCDAPSTYDWAGMTSAAASCNSSASGSRGRHAFSR
jgi:hypothetical protein